MHVAFVSLDSGAALLSAAATALADARIADPATKTATTFDTRHFSIKPSSHNSSGPTTSLLAVSRKRRRSCLPRGRRPALFVARSKAGSAEGAPSTLEPNEIGRASCR